MTERLQDVNLQLNMLTAEVQTGRLSLKDYLARLQKAIAHDRVLAVALKRNNDLVNAKKVLERVKIMHAEVESASQVQE